MSRGLGSSAALGGKQCRPRRQPPLRSPERLKLKGPLSRKLNEMELERLGGQSGLKKLKPKKPKKPKILAESPLQGETPVQACWASISFSKRSSCLI